MTIHNDVVEAIGNTPLIKLKRASEVTGCTILGKAEFMNPGQSVKDRAGKWMISRRKTRGFEARRAGGGGDRGQHRYRSRRGRERARLSNADCHSGHPEPGKKGHVAAVRRELVEVPALPYSNPNNYQHVGRRLADQLRKSEPHGVLFADQWNNLDNAKAHYDSTGPEIWEQTGGKLDGSSARSAPAVRWRASADT